MLAGMLAILAGVFGVLAGVLRLGFVTISSPSPSVTVT